MDFVPSDQPHVKREAETIKDIETGEAVGHLDSNGTNVYVDD
jgi:hypothetical protein